MVSRLYLLSTDVIGDRKPTNSRGCLEDHDLREALRGQLIEEWESREALNARLGTDAFGALMGAFDLLGDRDRTVYHICTEGFEQIEAARKSPGNRSAERARNGDDV
jgi:hypothetical protein